MKTRMVIAVLLLLFAAETAVLFFFAAGDTEDTQDAVLVNEILQTLQEDWPDLKHHRNPSGLDYVVLDLDGAVLFKTRESLSESINSAVRHRDTILDIRPRGTTSGRLILHNTSAQSLQSKKQTCILLLMGVLLLQCGICIWYLLYLNRRIIAPFHQLKEFSKRIASGNLDIPLEMDRHNLFGAFTESFDIMRSELKKARQAEAKANASKKELVAELSHDIKTPVASIKAASEVGAALSGNEKLKDNYSQIIRKADQINTLIENLFTAALKDLTQLSVIPGDMDSRELKTLLENSDYLHWAELPPVPDCLLYADKLRLQQVLDNIFANAYKYAAPPILLSASLEDWCLSLVIEDMGTGVSPEELPHIKEKFKRGSNAQKVEGAGLGLYISNYFMQEMSGTLYLENGKNGLKAVVRIALSGRI
ncbi:MAG: HAMP domain-containing histidine kinase [Firmicutes bacterium]|nr:HAMP domain-containing histidine kinase [Bacillota bacterium]